MADYAQPGNAYDVLEGEAPEILSRNLVAAGQLLAGATAFFFLTFLFAYFYLRSLNNADMWKPKHVTPSLAWGTIVMACMVASAMVVRFGRIDHRAGRREAFRLKALVGLGLGLASLVLQVFAWTHEPFGPSDGGYASVYFGWTAFLFLFVLGTMFWLETVVATSWRYRHVEAGGGEVPAGHASGDPGRMGHDIRNPVELNRAEIGALSYYWTFLAGIVVLAWVILYLI
jgi:heme/copper-type cytochrome/quinol oxidase subunit 3